MPKLHFVFPDGSEVCYALEGETLRLGRAEDNDLVIPDQRVSSHHAVLKRGASGDFIINDLGATNPTRINGRASPLQELKDGDSLQLGDTYARYEGAPRAPVATAAPGRPGRPLTPRADASPPPQGTGCFALLLAGGLLALGGWALAAW